MNISKLFWRAVPLLLFVLVLAGPAHAQFTMLEGEVIAVNGQPFPDVIVIAKNNDTGQQFETKTDNKGHFLLNGMRSGVWILIFKVKEQVVHERQVRVVLGANEPVKIDFKELLAKESAEEAAKRKKFEEERVKFEGMKSHFDAGRVAIDQASAVKADIQKTPAADRGPLTEKLAQLSSTAITELQAAQNSAPEKDPNLHIVMGNLGLAYDMAGRYDDSVAAYSKAVELKPDNTGYYQNLGTAQAKAGKVTEAMDTCDKVSKLSTATDAVQVSSFCYGNVGISLMNVGKMKEAIQPFRKATELNPKSADHWLYLGRCLLNAMDYKVEGGEMKMIPQPGTAEAFQKYLELAPDGKYADEAKGGLTALGTAIPTKVSSKKSKKP